MNPERELMAKIITVDVRLPGLTEEPWKYATPPLNALAVCGYTDWLTRIVAGSRIGVRSSKGHRLGLLPSVYRDQALKALDRMMTSHFTWSMMEIRDQQYGPMIYNVPTRTAFEAGLSYGQAFAAMSPWEAWS